MKAEKKIARIVGVLFITALASSLMSGVFLESVNTQDYLDTVSAHEIEIGIGVILLLILTVSVVTIPIIMLPILKNENERLAFGYIGARIFEGIADVIIAISPLLILTVGILENVPYSLGVLMFSYLLYQSKLVPRWLAVWGLIGGIIMLARVPISMFVLVPLSPYHEWTALLAIPIILNELVLAGWLIVKGFNSSAIASE
ncbi:MAG: DUF4386 domain-containing protein [Promethearchaeota archaeon]|jgi:hypothetical protein